jgi:phosphohistidine swiveling domain-containing protein
MDAMTAPALRQLRTALQAAEWVKGAVNYDEDLHFSSYYLRASCSGQTASLYPGYSSLVGFFENFNETYYLLASECRATAMALLQRALRQPRWLASILRLIRRHCDVLAGVFPPDMSPATLAALSDARLLALYRRHDRQHRILYRYARLPEALDRGGAYFTGYLREHLRNRGLTAAACTEAFALLARPALPSVLAQEIGEFKAIVEQARGQVPANGSLAAAQGRVRMLLAPELLERLYAHWKKWRFLSYHGYGRRELTTLDQYIDRLATELSARSAGQTSPTAPSPEQADRERRTLLQRLHIDPAHQALFAIYPEIGAVKLYRRHAQLRNFYYLDMLLGEIARRLDVNEWTVRCMLPEEVIASLQAGSLIDPAIPERRDGCVYALIGGREQVLAGKPATELRRLLQPEARPSSSARVLHGMVVSQGLAVGPCQVIIRADDHRSAFEKGTILVSESTDPDLVPLLRNAAAVLTEQGGVTAHAALICRELGVPAVIGIDGLLERVHDGDWVEVDAEAGTVTLLKRGRAALPQPELPPDQIGPKAYHLGVVQALGFRVPDYVVLPYDEVQRLAGRPASRRSRQVVQQVLGRLGVCNGDRLAVRSSAVVEDRDDASHAGEFRSLLNVRHEGMLDALGAFVHSNERSHNGTLYRGSVIVQRMVHGDCGGVCLTSAAHAGNGAAVIIEMTAGGNEGVTGGTVRPDRIVVDRLTGDILEEERRSAALRRQRPDVAQLVRQFLALEMRFGKPLDIEWVLAARDLYILQARPIVQHHASSW